MQQDFSRKMTVILREDLSSWPLTNTIGHISAFLGNKMKETFDTGDYFQSKDGAGYPRNSQYALVALKATKQQVKDLAQKLAGKDILWIAYTQDMIDMIDDIELAATLAQKESEELDILGVGIFGLKDELKELTGKLSLWK